MTKPASGWKKAKKTDQVDPGLASLKSSPSEVKNFIPEVKHQREDMPTRRRNQLDPLTETLGATGYFAMMRWSWFKYEYGGVKYALEVSRYYQGLNIAIDICKEDKIMHADLKERLLAENGIRYFKLKSATDYQDLLTQIRGHA